MQEEEIKKEIANRMDKNSWEKMKSLYAKLCPDCKIKVDKSLMSGKTLAQLLCPMCYIRAKRILGGRI